ncbi:flagellar biosynthetic protein FliO [Halopseudomonas salegens]|uniref:Flagellar protein n=1 Tax=Halopseudomonas salegens TaxID=1434072 RepID=A0A1H2END4_9GAMM|nr:flagellar biosynthetic protein FliO [Halopseudomonas salegens]SDT96463.1 flagellar protein FliO/FliZ [Halopseudomonas salegens]
MMRFLLPLVLFLSSPLVLAEPEAPPRTLGSATQVSLTTQILQLGLGLIVVVGLIFLLGYLMRRVGPMAGIGSQQIRVISSLPLGTRDRLLLVDVAGKQMLLGASAGRINTLHVFDEPVADLDAVRQQGDFARKLNALLKREPNE